MSKRIVQIDNVEYADGLFEAHKTNTPVDGLFSINGGVPKATNWMVVGDPGVGKSTVLMDIIANAKLMSNSKVLFISAEMNRVDLKLYVNRYPKFGSLDVFFPQEIKDDEDPRKVIREELNEGYDLVLIDSFVELQAIIQEGTRLNRNSSEKWLLNLMYEHNLGKNATKSYTSFLNIQQVNKGGVFVGSNKLKHMTTGMMEIRFVDENLQDERYIVFTKNRRGDVGKPMFFDLTGTGNVQYDTERFKKAEEIRTLKKKEQEKIKKEGVNFDKLFNINSKSEEE